MLDTKPVSAKSVGDFFGVDGKLLEEQYRDHFSNFFQWDQFSHAEDWLLFPENMGSFFSIDETSLSQGELYTIISNKEAKGGKGALIAIIKGTNSDYVREIIERVSLTKRKQVKEITLDMAPTMERIARFSFPNAKLVTDRFHVQKLAFEAVQEIRIKHRWSAIEQENSEIELAKETKQKDIPYILENGNTLKQLLARSRYLLFKQGSKGTVSQNRRAELLFLHYPDIKQAYDLSMDLGKIYHSTKEKGVAFTRLEPEHYITILNYFDNRSTNASAESLNAKIITFRTSFRGV